VRQRESEENKNKESGDDIEYNSIKSTNNEQILYSSLGFVCLFCCIEVLAESSAFSSSRCPDAT
jgi:hypothetical protein